MIIFFLWLYLWHPSPVLVEKPIRKTPPAIIVPEPCPDDGIPLAPGFCS